MDKLNFIKMSLENDLESLKTSQKENTDDTFNLYYKGAISSLEALKKKIEFIFEKEK